MKVYNYDEITKEYLYSEDAYLDPLASKQAGKDIYFVPVNATTIVPPEAPSGFIQVYENNSWVLIRDYRGKWQLSPSGDLTEVDYIGEPKNGYAVLSEQQYQKQLEDPLYYVAIDGKVEVNPNWSTIEKERIGMLSMTKLDFLNHICKPNGITYRQLMEIVRSSEEIEEAWELCSAVYRGDEVLCGNIKKFIPTITDSELNRIFKTYGG